MIEFNCLKCCAILELHGTHEFASTGKQTEFLRQAAVGYLSKQHHRNKAVPPYMIFTASPMIGAHYQKLIEQLKLGTVTSIGPQMNWTGRPITIYVWVVDNDNLKKWMVDSQEEKFL